MCCSDACPNAFDSYLPEGDAPRGRTGRGTGISSPQPLLLGPGEAVVFEGRIGTGRSLFVLGREEEAWGNGPVRTCWIGGGRKRTGCGQGEAMMRRSITDRFENGGL